MTRMPVRLALLVVCLAASGYAVFLAWSSERQSRLFDSSSRHFADTARAATAGVTELRAAQQAYVAAGQGPDFWYARVTALVRDLDDKLASMKSTATQAESISPLEAATGALRDFEQMDVRAREFTRTRQLTAAANLIFTDGQELTRKAAAAVERAVNVELGGIDGVRDSLRRTERYALAAAGAIVLLTLLLLLPAGRTEEREASPVMLQPPRRIADLEKETFADLDELGIVTHATRVSRATAPPAPAPAPAPVEPDGPAAPLALEPPDLSQAPAAGETPAVKEKDPAVSLSKMAALCGDLARVGDIQALPRLLERAATVLDASGIVIWIADPDGRELSPILVHGYPPSLATRLGTLKRDAENVTASAYRTGLLQTLKGDVISNGAVAAPLMSSGGCVGVMAAEVNHGGEQLEELLSAATIIAAQLATLVGPPAARSRAEATG
jgi:hypothetical protein